MQVSYHRQQSSRTPLQRKTLIDNPGPEETSMQRKLLYSSFITALLMMLTSLASADMWDIARKGHADTRGATPQLNVPLLVFHGLNDTALHSYGLNNTWDWNDAETTIVAVPGAGHFV